MTHPSRLKWHPSDSTHQIRGTLRSRAALLPPRRLFCEDNVEDAVNQRSLHRVRRSMRPSSGGKLFTGSIVYCKALITHATRWQKT